MGKNKKRSYITEIKNGDTTTRDSSEIAEALNIHFTTVGAELAATLDTSDINFSNYICNHSSKFKLVHTSNCEIQKLLENINPEKATGLDGIPPRLLKLAAPVLSKPLTILYLIIVLI